MLTDEQIIQRKVRCSALPRVLRCPASLAQSRDIVIGSGSADAQRGTHVHHALALHVAGKDVPFAGMEDDVRMLYYMALQIWKDYSDSLVLLDPPETGMSGDLNGTTITGTPDLIAQIPAETPTLVVWDWKTGTGSIGDYLDQLLGYAWLAQKKHPEYKTCKIIVAWVRDRAVEILDVDDAVMTDWEKRLKWALAHPEAYRPSEHACRYCGSVECEARAAYMRGAASALMKVEGGLVPADLAKLYPQSKALAKALRQYDAALRIALAQGPLDIGNGKVISLAAQPRKSVGVEKGLPALKASLPGVDLEPCLSIKTGELKKLISGTAAQGQKGKEIERVMGELEAAGAVETKTSEVISVRRKEKADGG